MIEIEYPFTEEIVRGLGIGDRVSLSGRIFTCRDRVHEKLVSEKKVPFSGNDIAIYHCGPIVVRQGSKWLVRSAGPTTSIRQEPYMSEVIRRHGVRLIIGKGGMGESTKKACGQYGCAYVHVVGGAGAVLAESVLGVAGVHYLKEFGAAEAMWEIDVKGLEGVVTIDSNNHSMHEDVLHESRKALAACG